MLDQYAANEQNWRSKDAAMFLVTTLASRGSTQRHGTTKISELVNIEEFTTMHVLPELTKPNSKYIVQSTLININIYIIQCFTCIINLFMFYVFS